MDDALTLHRDDALTVRPVAPADHDWVARFLLQRWGSLRMAAHGALFSPAEQPGLVAERQDIAVGLLTYDIVGPSCEITLIDSGVSHAGIGTALVAAVKNVARQAGCRRLWLVTTNDNLDALRFYQRREFVLCSLRPAAVQAARALKPEIPLVGEYGIPLRDELELELFLT